MNNKTDNLQKIEFSIEEKGYNVEQVDELIDNVIREQERLKEELSKLVKEIETIINNI